MGGQPIFSRETFGYSLEMRPNLSCIPLTEVPPGRRGRVCALQGESDFCSRLREMGFCESAVIERVSGRGTLLCTLCGIRIALSDRAARQILVELDPAAA